jgi:hypothetical protein
MSRRNAIRPRADYDRRRDLPPLLPLWPDDLADLSLQGTARLVAKLRRALREERRRGIGGHWAYDLARHARLRDAYQAETLHLRDLLRAAPEAGTEATARGARSEIPPQVAVVPRRAKVAGRPIYGPGTAPPRRPITC